MIKLFAILLISLGSFLEIYYYAFRFTNDGIETWLSIIIGITLTLLLCLAILSRNKKGIMFLILTLIVYSVLATSAGQSFSLSLVQTEEIQQDVQEQYIQDEISETQYRINQIDEKYMQIQAVIIGSTQTLEDRYTWKNTIAKAIGEQESLNNERIILKEYLSGLRSSSITHENIETKKPSTNTYVFYNELTNVPADWLQFIFQTWLSIFIAIMAPLGITILQATKKQKEEKPKEEKKPDATWIMLIEKWVHVNWFGVRSAKSNTILNETNFFEYTKAHGAEFPKKYYNRIKAIAIKTRAINNIGTILNNNEAEVIGRIVNNILVKEVLK